MKIAITGIAPLPVEEEQVTTGPGIRTWQFAKTISRAGNDVLLICLRNEGAYLKPPADKHLQSQPLDLITCHNLHYDVFTDGKTIANLIDAFKPAAIFGVASLLPVATAVELHDKAPVWADFFGDPFTEIQSKASIYPIAESDTELFHVWKLYRSIISRADKFSVVSNPQRFALMGQLAFCGRLNRHTPLYEFIHCIPCGFDPDSIPPVKPEPPFDTSYMPCFRGKVVGINDFIILWIGSYNTWVDIDTLFKGLEKAMAQNPTIQYVSLGGGTPGYNEKVFQDFQMMVAKSHFRERFIFRGWIPNADLEACFHEADIGINIDRPVYESEIGSRNRLLHLVARGLPVVSTVLGEFENDLCTLGMLKECEVGNPDSLAQAILECVEQDFTRTQMLSSLERDIIRDVYSFDATMESCLEWINEVPESAPDNVLRTGERPYLNPIEHLINEPIQQGQQSPSFLKDIYRKIFRDK